MKNYIKHFNLIILCTIFCQIVNAQPDPAVLAAEVWPKPAQWPRLSPEQYETFSFQIHNNGSATSSPSVKVDVQLDNLDFDIPFDPSIHITQILGNTQFTFAWNSTQKILTCTLNGPFLQLSGNSFKINNLVVTTGSPKPNNLIGGSATVRAPGPQNKKTENDFTEQHTFTSTRVTGSIWDDANGNASKDAGEVYVTNGIVWANLVDVSTNQVQYSVQVDASGNYLFNTIEPSTNFNVVLTTSEQAAGTNLTAAAQPDGWVPTGVSQDGLHNKDNRSGVLYLSSSISNYLNQNFGLEQPPIAQDKNAGYPAVIPDERYTLSPYYGLAPQPALSGIDPEDGDLGSGSTFIIKSLPANAKLFYNDIQILTADVASGTGTAVISNYNPNLLQFSFNSISVFFSSFTYSSVDAAGVASVPALYNIDASGILPVTGLQLKANWDGAASQLSWITLTEQNTSYFEIEKSADGVAYSKIGTTLASGNSSALKNYQFTDAATSNYKANYYRVKLVGNDGKKTVSNIAVITKKTNLEISIFPNPAQQFIMVKGALENAEIIILDMQGRIMQKQQTTGNSKQLLLAGYAAGTYVLQVKKDNNIITTKKFIKKQ